MCKQKCLSHKEISKIDACPIRCEANVLNMIFHSSKDKTKFLDECNSECSGKSSLGKYMGCYKDEKSRDLQIFLGNGLTVRQCFDKAKDLANRFVGLQYGNECWSGNNPGTYGKLSASQCSMVGNTDDEYLGHPVNWGNAWANSVYNITDYRHSKDCDW